MQTRARTSLVLAATLAAWLAAGCESGPGGEAGLFTGVGAKLAAGRMTAEAGSRPVSMLLGGALGFGDGYIVGVNPEKLEEQVRSIERDAALRANDRAERNPAEAEDVATAASADLNADGFVTVDEIVAMEQAGLGDEEELGRLRATGQLFELSAQQERYLEDRGISLAVVRGIRQMGDPYVR